MKTRNHKVFFIALEDVTNKIYSKQTSSFPCIPNRGTKYMVIFYIYITPMKSQSVPSEIKTRVATQAYRENVWVPSEKGIKPKFHQFDNEISNCFVIS